MKYRMLEISKRKITYGKTIKEIGYDKKAKKQKNILMKYVGKDNLKQDTYVFDIIQTGEDLYVIMTDKDPYIKGLKYSKTMGNIFKGVKL